MHRRIEARIVNPLLGDKIEKPSYASVGAAALDLRACIDAPLTIEPGKHQLIKTGLAVNMQDPGLAALVCSRSGLALKHQVFVLNAPGLIDNDFTGDIGVILANYGTEPFIVEPGDRVAQLMFQPVVQVEFSYVDEFAIKTERGEGGFGHTGKA